MFCSNCGSKLSEDGRFCVNCGKPHPNKPAFVTPPVIKHEQKEMSWEERFRSGWREFVSSPLVLVMIISYSAVQLLNLIAMDEAIESICSILDIFGTGANAIYGEVSSALDSVKLLIMLPGILIAVGMWMIYVDSADGSSRPIKTVGLTIIQGVQVAYISALVFMLFFVLSALGTVESELEGRMPSTLEQALSTAKTIMFVVVLICSAFYGCLIYVIRKIKQTADGCAPDGLGGAFVLGVLSIISGVISVFSIFSNEMFLSGLLGCVSSILLGIVLCQYKNKMEELDYIRRNNYSGRQSVLKEKSVTANGYPGVNAPDPNAYIPAWKRVQMGENSAVPEEKEVKTAKKCPECGTVQSGDNRVCYYCNAVLS